MKLVFLSVSLIQITVMLIAPDVVEASSPPWTITCEYGETDSLHPSGHKGVDFALPNGTELKSVVEGTVEVARDEGDVSYGKSVRIKTDDGKLVIYGHLSDMAVKPGDHIEFGEVIGHSGNTGRSTGPHLHFQVNRNGTAINPMPTIWTASLKKALLSGG